jgi:hypothetical protein
MMLIDDYTRITWVSFLKNKSEAFEKFKAFKALVENETDRKSNAQDQIMEASSHPMNLNNSLRSMEEKDSVQLQ